MIRGCLLILIALFELTTLVVAQTQTEQNTNGLNVTITVPPHSVKYSDRPLVLFGKQSEGPPLAELPKLYSIIRINAGLDLKLQFRPEFKFEVLPKTISFLAEMLRPLKINLAKPDTYVGTFVPNLLLGGAHHEILADGTYNNETRILQANFRFVKEGVPTALPIQLITQKLGAFRILITELSALARIPESADDAVVIPIECSIPDASLGQKLICLALIWKAEKSNDWHYRFLIYGNESSTDSAEVLHGLGEPEIHLRDFFSSDTLSQQDLVFSQIDKLPCTLSSTDLSHLHGIPGQALFFVEGKFGDPSFEKIFTRLLIEPESRNFSIPGVLPGFSGHLSKDSYVHLIYQNIDRSLPTLAIDFIEFDKYRHSKRSKANIAWRPIRSIANAIEEETFHSATPDLPIIWFFTNLAVATADKPLSWLSRIFLGTSGDRFLINTSGDGEIWNKKKLVRTISFKRHQKPQTD